MSWIQTSVAWHCGQVTMGGNIQPAGGCVKENLRADFRVGKTIFWEDEIILDILRIIIHTMVIGGPNENTASRVQAMSAQVGGTETSGDALPEVP